MILYRSTIDEARNEAHKQYNKHLSKLTVVVFKDDNLAQKYITVVDPSQYNQFSLRSLFDGVIYKLVGKGE
ncbi:hypothetical protein [Priestia megaterium]|uniref:hypothetical protein n=1 Tax=Priestia megaterium TaxID=1404 RepID=UPI0028773312|nr:hypothetical protein [Priestia megaterium]MBX4163511.1 hypothetical protein [Priestia megaterium]